MAIAASAAASLAAAAAPGDAAAGKQAFAPCAACHQVGPSAHGWFGPPLNGIFGRKAGSSPGFRYSAALVESKIVWSEQSLSAFIKDPGRTVPGTRMRFYSIGYDDRKIADLLAYLRSFQPPP